MKQYTGRIFLMKKLIYITILTALLPATMPSINIGLFRLSIFRVCFLLMSIGYFSDLFKNRKTRLTKENWNQQSYSIVFMIVWLSFAILSGIWVKDYLSWLKTIYFISVGTISALVFKRYLTDLHDIIKVFRLMTPLVLIHHLLGWSEVITGSYLFLHKGRFERYIRYKHPVSIFGNTNDFAVFLMFTLFFSLIIFLITKDRKEKFLHVAIMVSSVGLIHFSGSRSTVLGLVMALYFGLFLKKRKQTIKYTKIGLLLLIPIGLIIYFAFPSVVDQYKTHYLELASGVNSFTVRWNLLKNAWVFFLKTFGFGVGSGNIEFWMEHYPVYETAKVFRLHNWWLEILVAYGIGIFAMYLVFYYKLIVDSAKTALQAQEVELKRVSFGMFLTLIAFILGSISPSSNMKLVWMWIFMSLMIAVQSIGNEKARELK